LVEIQNREISMKKVRKSANVSMQPIQTLSPVGKSVSYKTGYDFFKNSNFKQPYKRNWDRPEFLSGSIAPPLLPSLSHEVRVSSNPNDTNIEILMGKLMVQRVDHCNFDPIMCKKETRNYMQGLIFQDSILAPYKPFLTK
jgi:hypothetical protein